MHQMLCLICYIHLFHSSDHYIVSVSWINSTAVSAIWMNRNQNLSVVVHCLQQNNWMCYEVCIWIFLLTITYIRILLTVLYWKCYISYYCLLLYGQSCPIDSYSYTQKTSFWKDLFLIFNKKSLLRPYLDFEIGGKQLKHQEVQSFSTDCQQTFSQNS